MADTVTVERDIAAPAAHLYEMVADLTRMGEWSPEAQGGEWIGGASGPALGAKFKGKNQRGWRKWSTTARVTDAEPGKQFAFVVTAPGGMKVAEWSYTFEPADGACKVTESWIDLRNPVLRTVSQWVTGVTDRPAQNRTNMVITLDRLAAVAQRQPA